METVIITKNEKVSAKMVCRIKETYITDKLFTLKDMDIILHFFEYNDVDMVFLDIEDELTNWQEMWEKISYIDKKIKIVLLCVDNNYAVKAYEMGVFDYIIKPIRFKRLMELFYKLKYAG